MKKGGFNINGAAGRAVLTAAVILLMLICSNSTAINGSAPAGLRLKDIQDRVLIGTATCNSFWNLPDADTYTDIAAAEFNILTPENQMKWEALHPFRDEYFWENADQHVSWAEARGMKVHGHTLIWHKQIPFWLAGVTDAAVLTSYMYDHIDTVLGHFKGRILVWDVVNEAFDDDGNYRNSFWYEVLGKDYIEKAFIRARAADPGAKLIYNDYNIENSGVKSNAVYNMLKDFKTRGIPVDGIGFQMHLDIQYGFNYNDFASNMQRFADLGLEIYITEMDVRVPENPSAADLEKQAAYYRGVIEKCMAQPAVKAIQFWGFTDNYSWIPQTFPGRGAALLFDENYKPKLAYYAVQSALGGGNN